MVLNPHCSQTKASEAECLAKYIEAVADEEMLLFQKGKVEWLQNGDKNSKFFHRMIQSRRYGNRIMSICNEEGARFEGDMVAEQFVNHFSKFLGSVDNVDPIIDADSLFTNKLSDTEALEMIGEVTDSEIKSALFDIGDAKAPGPDGFSVFSFKKSWSIVGKDVCVAVKDFSINGKLPGEVNATLGSYIVFI